MGYFKLNTDGTIQSANKQHSEEWIPLSELETKKDGSFYTYYNEDGTPDLSKEEAEAQAKLYDQWKADRQEKVDNIEVTYNDVIYQGDETSQTRMDRAIRGLEKEDELYPDTAPHTQTWVAKDNSSHQLTAEDLTLIMVEAGRIQGQLWNEGRPSA